MQCPKKESGERGNQTTNANKQTHLLLFHLLLLLFFLLIMTWTTPPTEILIPGAWWSAVASTNTSFAHTSISSLTLFHTYTLTHTLIHTLIHTLTHTLIHTLSLTHTHYHTHSHSLTHTLTHSLTHTHSLSLTLSHKLAHEACALCVHTTETELNKRKEQASNAISWARGCQGVSWMSCGCGTVMLQSVLKSTEWKHLYPHIRSSTMHCE